MKIIGAMVTWNNYEFFRRALRQMKDFCDDVILVEGCHSQKYPQRSTDGTAEYVQALKDQSDIKVIDFDLKKRYDITQRRIRSEAPKRSLFYKPNNWLIHWDDDRFFFPKHLKRLRKAMETTKADALAIPERHFIYNFRFHYWQKNGLVWCYRILDDFAMKGVSTHLYKNGKPLKTEVIQNIKCYHYSYVKNPIRMKARWVMSIEKGCKESKNRFNNWMGVKWKNDEDLEKDWNKKRLKAVRDIDPFGIYEGNHPPILDDHPMRHIKDSRLIECAS